jgi:hypothetical protein
MRTHCQYVEEYGRLLGTGVNDLEALFPKPCDERRLETSDGVNFRFSFRDGACDLHF